MSGYSLWCDFIERDFLENKFRDLINRGAILGATSNPSIFAQALKSEAYKNEIQKLKGKIKAKEIYENLAFSDIKRAAELLLPLWKKDKNDGYISIEIDPNLCFDAPKSIDEGKRIIQSINMPNVMIKIPATEAGFEVICELYKCGININATLIFSRAQTIKCLNAIKKTACENRAVISIFVSRFDSVLEQENLAPKAGIYNASVCYNEIENVGNKNIRALFASTGAKNKQIAPHYYVEKLAFPNAINTAPLGAIDSVLENPSARDLKTPDNLEVIKKYLAPKGIDKVAEKLLESGLKAFIDSFNQMLKEI